MSHGGDGVLVIWSFGWFFVLLFVEEKKTNTHPPVLPPSPYVHQHSGGGGVVETPSSSNSNSTVMVGAQRVEQLKAEIASKRQQAAAHHKCVAWRVGVVRDGLGWVGRCLAWGIVCVTKKTNKWMND